MNPTITLTHVVIILILCLAAGVGILHWLSPNARISPLYGFVLLFAAGVVGYLFSTWYVRRVRTSRFTGRETLSPEEIYRRYFHDTGLRQDVVVRQWQETAKSLELPSELLRPTDRFDTELRPLAGWPLYDDQVEHLFAWAMGQAKMRGTSIDLSGVATLGHFVALAAWVRERMESGVNLGTGK